MSDQNFNITSKEEKITNGRFSVLGFYTDRKYLSLVSKVEGESFMAIMLRRQIDEAFRFGDIPMQEEIAELLENKENSENNLQKLSS